MAWKRIGNGASDGAQQHVGHISHGEGECCEQDRIGDLEHQPTYSDSLHPGADGDQVRTEPKASKLRFLQWFWSLHAFHNGGDYLRCVHELGSCASCGYLPVGDVDIDIGCLSAGVVLKTG